MAYAAVVALVGLGMLPGCGSEQTQGQGESVALVDTGPNAQLGNNELLAKALSNMKALNSFHVQFTEQPKDLRWDPASKKYQATTTAEVSSTITIMADIQEVSKGSRFKLIYDESEELGHDQEATFQRGFVRERHTTDVLVTEKALYESKDGGNGWIEHGPGSAGFVLLPVAQYTVLFGTPPHLMEGPDYVGYLSKDLVFEDANPRLEEIDGTITRHIEAKLKSPTPGPSGDPNAMNSMWYERVESMEMWISTDAEPRIIQMGMVVRSNTSEFLRSELNLPDKVLYDLNWKWSRFNEDLGTFEAPSGEALITPSP